MDRAHRLGQTREVWVYRLVLRGTVEERILQRASQKSTVQHLVMANRRSGAEPSVNAEPSAEELGREDVLSMLGEDVGPGAAKPLG